MAHWARLILITAARKRAASSAGLAVSLAASRFCCDVGGAVLNTGGTTGGTRSHGLGLLRAGERAGLLLAGLRAASNSGACVDRERAGLLLAGLRAASASDVCVVGRACDTGRSGRDEAATCSACWRARRDDEACLCACAHATPGAGRCQLRCSSTHASARTHTQSHTKPHEHTLTHTGVCSNVARVAARAHTHTHTHTTPSFVAQLDRHKIWTRGR